MKKRFIAAFLTVCMVLGMLPGTAWAAEIASGTCGDNLTWTLDDEGLLTISGTGDMEDFDVYLVNREAPWYPRSESIFSVHIEDGVTSIGNEAFYHCYSLMDITIPDGVTSIGDHAFAGCVSLTSVTIPGSVTSIGDSAFDSCDSLTDIDVDSGNSQYSSVAGVLFDKSQTTLICCPGGKSGEYIVPDGVTSIGDSAFLGCSSLTGVTISDGVTSIGDYAFYGCHSLTGVTIPDGVTSIGDHAFEVCDSLTSVTIPGSVASIGDYAFDSCDSLTGVTISDGVTSIGDYAFSSCYSLTDITIPGSVTSIGGSAFGGCISLTDFYVDSDNPAYSSAYGLLYNKEKSILLQIPRGKFLDAYGPEPLGGSIIIVENCNEVSPAALGHGLDDLCFFTDYIESELSDFIDATIGGDWASTMYIGALYPAADSRFSSYLLNAGFADSGGGVYEGYGIRGSSVTFYPYERRPDEAEPPETTIVPYPVTGGNIYFDTATGTVVSCDGSVTAANIPAQIAGVDVIAIGEDAFSNCSSLTSVSIPDSVTSIADYAFSYCSSLTSINIPDGVTSIGDYVFFSCSDLTSVTIPEGVTSIGDYAFSRCHSLASVTIPEGVTSIGTHAFSGCNGLTSVSIPDGVTSIGDYVFFSCSGLTSVTIPEGVTSIGGYAFSRCSSLASVTIPEGVTSIGTYAFSGCSSLVSVTIPGSVATIGFCAFSNYVNNSTPVTPLNDDMVIYYTGTPAGWERIEKRTDASSASIAAGTTICYFPTFDEPQISSGATDPVVTVTADIAFNETIDISSDIRVETDADLTLVSAASGTVTRSGDYTLTLQFSGTAQNGDELTITVLHTAFSVLVGAAGEKDIDTVLPPITITAEPPHIHADADGDGYCDDDGTCLHTMGGDGYCTDGSCTHSRGCDCGGPAPVTPVTPVTPNLPAPTPTPSPAPSVTPEPKPRPESPVVVAVDDTIAAGEQETVTISGQGESDMQYIVKDGAFTDWIDRVDLPRYAIDLYTVLCIGGDNDTLYDLLIKDEYFNFSGSAGSSSEEANVESVLELVSQLDTPYSSGSGLFGESSFAGGFDIIDTTAGDRSINYGELKEGDVVRTSSCNGIFVTSVAKDGNKNYEQDLEKACTYANTAFQAFDRDHPEVFWLSGKSKMRMVTVTMRQGEQAFKETYVFFVLADTDGFTVRDDKYSSQDKIEADIQRMEKAVETILKTVTAKTPNEQAAQLNRWLTEHNEYNTSEDLLSLPNWPHECLSALVGSVGKDGPVCDGYSRAFKVLCGRLDIPCVLVDGHARPSADSEGEFHMWNSAQMPDGKWYGVDVTWNDPTVKGVSGAKSGHEREDFLLVGADTVIFGLKFSESHPPKNRAADGGVAFVNGPTLSVAAFKPLAAASVLPFTDVTASSWYYGAVEYVFDNDLMTGESSSVFAPGGAMTRAMVWTVLGRMAGADVNGGTPWYSGAQSWAVGAEVSDGSNPGGSISREELVTMLWRTQGSPDAEADLSSFTDGGSVSGWADGAMRWAVSTGLLEGSDGKINPTGRATRAEVAAILTRFCKVR